MKNLRSTAINRTDRKVSVSRLADSSQKADLTLPPNCGGYGRIRHFRMSTSEGWPSNPLPIVPACRSLGIAEIPDEMDAQVFQNAVCPWRCWYCFVPYDHLRGDPRKSTMLTCEELVDLYRAECHRPNIIVLSGGSPSLVPEWRLWMMDALESAGLEKETYLWSDDELSNKLMFEEFSDRDIDRIQQYKNYGQVCCFKGFDAESCAFNLNAPRSTSTYEDQLAVMSQILQLDIDVYVYVTLTTPALESVADGVRYFIDDLQQLSEFLPLRTVPLEIKEFTPLIDRGITDDQRLSLDGQRSAINVWNVEIERRFSLEMRRTGIADVRLR